MRTTLAILTAITLAGCNADPSTPIDDTSDELAADPQPDGKGQLTRDAHTAFQAMSKVVPAARPVKGNGISYHGGPVMTGTVDIYFIWYGNWGSNTAKTILPDFMSHLGGSGYEHINSTYYNSAGTHVSGNISYKSSYSTSAYLGTSLSDAQILQVVSDALTGNHLPYDGNAIYFVLTSKEVTASSGQRSNSWSSPVLTSRTPSAHTESAVTGPTNRGIVASVAPLARSRMAKRSSLPQAPLKKTFSRKCPSRRMPTRSSNAAAGVLSASVTATTRCSA